MSFPTRLKNDQSRFMLCMVCHWHDTTHDNGLEVCIDKEFTTDEDKFETQANNARYKELSMNLEEPVCILAKYTV